MNKIIYCVAVVALSLCACAQPHYTQEEMELRKDIGEMLVVGFRGTELQKDNHIVRDIQEYGVGGVILFEFDVPSQSRPRNISSAKQLRKLCADLQGLDSETLFISIDQEGGRVNRLKSNYGFPSFASPAKTARNGDDSVRYYAVKTARTLHSMGINLNFAPCVDVNVNPQCPIIGKLERSFSDHPSRVAECAQMWIDAQRAEGVMSCLKHFPGHGSSRSDTHQGCADVTDTWQLQEIEPYKALIARYKERSALPYMIMTTHVFNARFDSVWPATLSAATLTGLLRDSMQYNGLIVTDDLAMGAMVKQFSYEKILEQAINAGANMLCLSNNGAEYDPDLVPKTVDAIFRLVKNGKVSAEAIRLSAAKIRDAKQQLSSGL